MLTLVSPCSYMVVCRLYFKEKTKLTNLEHWHSHTDTTHILWWALSHTHCSVMKHLLTYFMKAELCFCKRICYILSPHHTIE